MDDAETDSSALDISVERFIVKARRRANANTAIDIHTSIQGAPVFATWYDLGKHGGSLKLVYSGLHEVVSFMPVDLARDLAYAINGVLMRHTAAEKPAHERVRDIVVDDRELPF